MTAREPIEIARGPEPFRPVRVDRWRAGAIDAEGAADAVAAEEPLQITLDGEPFAVVMRTPGHDLELVLGLLYAEGVVSRADEIREASVAASALGGMAVPAFPVRPLPEAENLVELRLRTAPRVRAGWQRNLVASSACGICGAAALDALRQDLAPLPPGPAFPPAAIARFASGLRDTQGTFDLTGGLHAAGLFAADGSVFLAREDVGRHNAVDKLVGHALLAGWLPLRDRALVVSGRASFELAHKAVAAGVPLLAAVSAPSSLAVHVAHTFDLTLIGFLRDGRWNVYAAAERIARDERGRLGP